MLDEFADPITTMASARGDLHQRSLSVGGGEAQVGATWLPQIRETLFGRLEDVGPLAVRQRGLGEEGDGLLELGERSNLVARFDAMDVVGSDRHRADRLFVTFVTDVDDLVALLGAVFTS